MTGQLDTIQFVYGFSLLLLCAVLWSGAQAPGERLPWSRLAWFGLLYGLTQWLEMLAISLGDSTEFKAVRLALMAASFLSLMEFGRLGLRAQGVHTPGTWALAPLLALAGLGGLEGLGGLNAACRYALGLPGGMLAGWVLVRESAKGDLGERWPHRMAGLALLIHGVATGLIVPKADFFPAFWLNQEAFVAFCGFPVQLISAFCVATASMGFWLARRREIETRKEVGWLGRWILPILVAVLLTGGFWVANWRGDIADAEQRDRLLQQATALARTISVERAKTLSFSAADKFNPAFQRLGGQMMAFARAVNARSLYTTAVRGGKILFGPESLAEDDPLASPPGTVYEKPPIELSTVFRTQLPQTCGPYTDEYGSFVSAFAPVVDPRTGEVVLVIGADLEAGTWRVAVAFERLYAIVFTLILVVICLGSSVLLAKCRSLSTERRGWQIHAESWITAAVGVTLTLGLVHVAVEDVTRSRRILFAQTADALAHALVGRMLDVRDHVAASLAHLLETDPAVSREVFRAVAGPRITTQAIAALGWAPRVAAGDKAAWEERARLEGLRDFTIHEESSEGRKRPPEARDEYYPLFFVEPRNGTRHALGLDISASAERWPAAREALRSGMSTATDVIQTVGDPVQKNIDVFTPVFREGAAALDLSAGDPNGRILGLVCVTLGLDALLKETLSGPPVENGPAVMALYHLETGRHPALLGVRARDLVRQLLAFSRKQILEIRPVDLNQIVVGFAKLARRTIREDISIGTILDAGIPAVQADAGQMEQVIMNLLLNAQDAMPEGGRITIQTAPFEVDRTSAEGHADMAPGRYVMLAVRDTGEGMDAELRDRIFIPFFTTKAMGKGTGLGLATVYGIVKQHGGYIWVDSEPGRGTTFKIHLPAMEAPAPVEEVPPEESTAFRGTETVMVVEDNEMVRDLAVKVLLHLGYRVLAAESGSECLRMLGEHTGPLDLLLTDVVMPEMNGKALFEQVSARFPHVKVLYMSGYAEDVIAHRGVLDEDVNFIQKPFSLQSLAAKVREVLEGQDGRLRLGTQDPFDTTGAGRHR